MTGYEQLAAVLDAALAQAATGKGRERHANGLPFMDQPMMQIARMVGIGFPAGQLAKKAQEAVGMAARGQHDAARAELLGAIIYAAGAYLALPPDTCERDLRAAQIRNHGGCDDAPVSVDTSWPHARAASLRSRQRDPGDEDDGRSTTAQALWGGLQAQPCSAWLRRAANGGGVSVTTTEDDS